MHFWPACLTMIASCKSLPLPWTRGQWKVTIVAYDYPGELSLICGLLFVHGFSICQGGVFTYEDELPQERQAGTAVLRRKIVDVFTVVPLQAEVNAPAWRQYSEDLAALLRLMQAGERRQARGRLAKESPRPCEDLLPCPPSSIPSTSRSTTRCPTGTPCCRSPLLIRPASCTSSPTRWPTTESISRTYWSTRSALESMTRCM